MSETTTDASNQTLPGFLKRLRAGFPICTAFLAYNINRIANVLETIVGVNGIVIKKTHGADGVGWTIDGSGIVPKTDDCSIEVNAAGEVAEDSDGKLQVVNFPETGIRTVGITDVLSADISSGKLKANHASQYDLLVRVKNYDGTHVGMGYMPIGDNPTGEDPDGTGDNGGGTVDDWCQHLNDPDGGGGGGGGGGTDNGHLPDGNPDGSGEGGSGGGDGDHSDGGSHPGKSGPCW